MKNLKKILSVLGVAAIVGLSVVPAAFASSYSPVYMSINTPTNTTATFNTGDGSSSDYINAYLLTAGSPASTPTWVHVTSSGALTHTFATVPDVDGTYYIVASSATCAADTFATCLGLNVSPGGAYLSYSLPIAANNTTAAATYFGTEQANLQTMLYTNIPTVLEIGFALIGLGIAIHYVRKWVGKKA